jgi:hypothetical protein
LGDDRGIAALGHQYTGVVGRKEVSATTHSQGHPSKLNRYPPANNVPGQMT